MCGICGELAFGGTADRASLETMAGKLHSRGPDAEGYHLAGPIGLAHRRLSIIDLSERGTQPMRDDALGLTIVFNGCIYNYPELRRELEASGYSFSSTSDTEVILKAFHKWGADCVKRFHGMFAFAIHDDRRDQTVLVRDRLGIKPLYWTETAGKFRFASTPQALLAAGGVDTTLDPVAVHYYMSMHAAVPAPRTILNGIRKLAAATIMTIEADGRRSERRYWSLDVGPREADAGMSFGDWSEALLDHLQRAVHRRRVADVPIGVLLSGGLDSSLIVALLARDGQDDIKTFSVGFDAVNGIAGDEFQYSDIIAREFGTDHHRIAVDASRTIEALDGVIAAMSEPMMSHDCVGFYLLSQEVSKHIKVVQSGQGADEVFGGYHWYPRMMASEAPAEDYAAIYFDRDHAEMQRTLADGLLGADHSMQMIRDYFADNARQSAIDRTLQLDTEVMLIDDPVKRVDNMTMAFGLEARVPFLDHELVELAARIPAEYKVAEGGKYILKEMARSLVPAEVIDRPKGYFPVPALKHVRGQHLDFVRSILTRPEARERQLFKSDYVEKLLADPDAALTPKGHSKLWQVFVLEYWLQTHGI
jgi:asparagine synthase (glutamine-hydrolysing)